MVHTQELVSPPVSSFDFDREFGEKAGVKIVETVGRFRNSVDSMFDSPLLLGEVEISSKVLTETNFLDSDGLNAASRELKDLWKTFPKERTSLEAFDSYLISWSHFLLTGEHLAAPEMLEDLARQGKEYADLTLKSILSKGEILDADLLNLSDASLFLTLTDTVKTKDRYDLPVLKKGLKKAF